MQDKYEAMTVDISEDCEAQMMELLADSHL
jgi:hypothetical protein